MHIVFTLCLTTILGPETIHNIFRIPEYRLFET